MGKWQFTKKAVSVLTAFTLALPLFGQGLVAYADENRAENAGGSASASQEAAKDQREVVDSDSQAKSAADTESQSESGAADEAAPAKGAESTADSTSESAEAPSSDSAPVPGADAPQSPTNAETHIEASVEDFASEEELDEAYSKLMMRSARDYSSATFADVLVYADQYVGLPYVWGGKDLYRDGGFDCSGFVNWVYNHVCGMNINSDYTSAASLYYNYCTPISEKDARPGDIVFWKGTYGSLDYISHVGIYCGNGVTIDAGDPIGYDRVTDIKNMNGKTAERVYGRLVSLSDTSIRLDSAIVKARVSDRAYTGSAQEPKPTVVAAGSVLKEGTDYTLSYSNNVNVGTASVTIKGKGNYRGSVTKNFKIYKDTFKAGTYMASSALRSNFVMDVADGSTGAGAGIQLYSSNGTDAQRFKIQKTSDGYYTIQNSKSDLYLTLYTTWADLKNGQQVTQRSYTGGMSQKWCMEQNSDGTYTVVSAMDSSMAIDVANGNAFNGAVVQAWESNGSAAQRWSFSSAKTARQRLDALAASSKGTVAAGTYEVRSAVRSSAVLDAVNGGTSNGTAVQVYGSNGTDAQRWTVEVGSDGYLTIKSAKSGLVLDVAGGNAYSGAKLQLYAANGTRAQKWVAVSDGKGVKLVSALDEGLVVDLPSGSARNGNVLQLYSANGSSAQRWMFDAVAKGGAAKTVFYPYSLSYIANLNQVSANTLNPNAVSSNSNAYYQFMDCRGYTGQVSASQMNRIIDNTEKGRQGVFHGRGQAIIDAAKAANINEMYLMAHMMIETGWGTSAQANGKYFAKGNATIKSDGKTYTKNCPAGTYYNFIGWGAYDSNPNTAYDYARYYGWNSVDAALKGAAEKLAKFYLYNGQETVYEMRWNPDAASLGKTHQYCTSTNWAESIGITIGYNYRLIGVTPKASFIVPKYL
ncbi:RICIN domain-containing protein [Senegalimassilia sp.]|uniref:RICIN domain-containing protein n=1 Tax=Senegalimassilia sp. TaxID=1922200 RepID=UPI0028458AD4|nr:RICIN domain-containing protein [Senegalimassilia sp.]MDR3885573.1 RICIN domain-containing protein [Senegalimassilia sp.]